MKSKKQEDPELEAFIRIQQEEDEADRARFEDGDLDDFDEDDPHGARPVNG